MCDVCGSPDTYATYQAAGDHPTAFCFFCDLIRSAGEVAEFKKELSVELGERVPAKKSMARAAFYIVVNAPDQERAAKAVYPLMYRARALHELYELCREMYGEPVATTTAAASMLLDVFDQEGYIYGKNKGPQQAGKIRG